MPVKKGPFAFVGGAIQLLSGIFKRTLKQLKNIKKSTG